MMRFPIILDLVIFSFPTRRSSLLIINSRREGRHRNRQGSPFNIFKLRGNQVPSGTIEIKTRSGDEFPASILHNIFLFRSFYFFTFFSSP